MIYAATRPLFLVLLFTNSVRQRQRHPNLNRVMQRPCRTQIQTQFHQMWNVLLGGFVIENALVLLMQAMQRRK